MRRRSAGIVLWVWYGRGVLNRFIISLAWRLVDFLIDAMGAGLTSTRGGHGGCAGCRREIGGWHKPACPTGFEGTVGDELAWGTGE